MRLRKRLASLAIAASVVAQMAVPAFAADGSENTPDHLSRYLTDSHGQVRTEVGKMSSENHEIIDVKVTDGKEHRLSIFLLDEDKSGRWSIVDVIDPLNQKILDSQNVSDFSDGVYLNYEVSGHVQIRLTNIWKTSYKSSKDTAIHGIFIDDVDAKDAAVAKVTTKVAAATSTATKVETFNVLGKYFTENATQPLKKRVPSIEVRFDGNIAPDDANLNKMTVTSGGQAVPGEWRTSFYSATFVPKNYLMSGTYTVTIPNTVTNIQGEAIAEAHFEFTVQPTMEVIHSNTGSMNSETPRVDVTYSDRYEDAESGSNATLSYKNQDDTYREIKTKKKGSNGGLMLEIIDSILPSGTYRIKIPAGIVSVSGATSAEYVKEFAFDSTLLAAKINAPKYVKPGSVLPITLGKCVGYDLVRFAFDEETLKTTEYQPVKRSMEIAAPATSQDATLYAQFKVTTGEHANYESPLMNKAVTVTNVTWGKFVPFDMSAAFDKDGFASHGKYSDGVFDKATEIWDNTTANACSDSFKSMLDTDGDAKITHETEEGNIPFQLSPNIYVDGKKNMATNNGKEFSVPKAKYSDIYILAVGKADNNEATYTFHYTDGTSENKKIESIYWEHDNPQLHQFLCSAHCGWRTDENNRPYDSNTFHMDEHLLQSNPEKTLASITIAQSASLMRTMAVTGREAPTYEPTVLLEEQAAGDDVTYLEQGQVTNADGEVPVDMEELAATYGDEPEIMAALDNTEISNVPPMAEPGQPVLLEKLVEEAKKETTGAYGQTLYPYARQVEKIMSYKIRMQAYENYELNFEDSLEVIRKVDNVTRGLEKKVYMVGWQLNGHDTSFPQLDIVNERHKIPGKTAVESLKWLIEEGKKYNTTVVLHVNVSDVYVDDSRLGPDMVENNIITRGQDGSLTRGWPWSGHRAYIASSWANWFTGSFRDKQVGPLLKMLPELEGQSIHPDAWYTWDNPYYGKTTKDTADAKRRMVKHMRDAYNMDITTEFEAGFDSVMDDDFIGYFPMIWQYGWSGDIVDPMKVPAYIQTGINATTREAALTKNGKYFGFGLAIEPNLYDGGVNAPIQIPGIKGEFAQQELTHQFFNAMLRNSLVDDVTPLTGFDKINTNSKGGQAVLYTSAGEKVVSKWNGNNSQTMKRTVTMGEDVLVQEPGNVFMPMVWRANREIQAWSEAGFTDRAWKLPTDWDGVALVDIYDVGVDGLKYVTSKDVVERSITFTLTEDQSVVVVPQGQDPNSTDRFAPQGTVRYIDKDTATKGNWTEKYGKAGYDIFDSKTENHLPESVKVSYINASYKKVKTGYAKTYTVTVTDGTGDGVYEKGATVAVAATVPSGKQFKSWTAKGITLGDNATKSSFTFVMPANVVTLTASFEAIPYTPGPDPVTPPAPKPEAPKTVGDRTTVTIEVKPITKGDTASAKVPEKTISDGISSAVKAAEETGTTANVEIKVSAPKNATTAEVTLPKKSVIAVADSKVENLVITTPVASIALDSKALAAIGSAAGGDVTISAGSVDAKTLTDKQQKSIVDRPVFDFAVRSGGKSVAFDGGVATVSIPYTRKEGEKPAGVVVFNMDDKGALTKIKGARYDEAAQIVTFATTHFSLYVVGYDNLAAWESPFTDVKSGSWYYEGVAYSVQNGLFGGTSATTFAPMDNMTRGMLWAVLYRHAGQTAKTEGAIWYADAQKWAVEQGISDGLNPEGDISREQLATILFRYAKGETTTADMSGFADADGISGFAKEAMDWAVSTGLLLGSGGKLNPKGNATRGETALILMNFVSLVAQ